MNFDHIKEHFHKTKGFIHLLNMKITDISYGYCKGEMPMNQEILNPLGIVHGGKDVVTVDSTIHYLAPACDTEKLIAEAKEVKYGSKVAVYEVNIFKDDGTIVATSMQSYFITEAS